VVKRALLICVGAASGVVAAWGVAAATGLAGVQAEATQLPRASLQGMVCQRAANPLDRAVSVTAVMRPVSGTQGMELKFALQRRSAGTRSYVNVTGRDLGLWLHPSNPTLGQQPGDTWRLNKEVVNLSAPAFYRFLITFRWLGRSGHPLARVTRLSGTCYQP
jgi:hypothetical protein